jgi:hypothetical protein
VTGPADRADEFGAGPTGLVRVDQALDGLAQVVGGEPAEQVGALTEVDRALRETLDTIGDV